MKFNLNNTSHKPIIHGDGFVRNYYVCSSCGSKAMKHEPHSISGRIYLCMTCGSVEFNPRMEVMTPPYLADEDKNIPWLSIQDLADVIHVKKSQLN